MSVVSDSYDIYNACSKLWGEELKGKVDERLAKTGPPQGRLVVRPDSGEPKDVVVKCLELLGEKFGTSTTSSGHKLLPKHVRVLQGDGISYETVGEILAHMAEKGWAVDNVLFGSGGALLQKLNRDTQKRARRVEPPTLTHPPRTAPHPASRLSPTAPRPMSPPGGLKGPGCPSAP